MEQGIIYAKGQVQQYEPAHPCDTRLQEDLLPCQVVGLGPLTYLTNSQILQVISIPPAGMFQTERWAEASPLWILSIWLRTVRCGYVQLEMSEQGVVL